MVRADRVAANALTSIVERVVPAVIESIDVDAVIQRVDIDALLARVDVNALLDRADTSRLLARVDLDALLESLDLNALLARIDIDALLENIDVAELARRAEIGDLVARSSSELAGSTLDTLRRQLADLDLIILRVVARLLGRSSDQLRAGPELLVGGSTSTSSPS